MNIHDLTVNQLKRAVAIREQIDALNKQLSDILGVRDKPSLVSINNRGMSASVRRKIAAAQRARWAKLRKANSTRSAANTTAKKTTNASANARRSAKLKAYWAAKKKAAKR